MLQKLWLKTNVLVMALLCCKTVSCCQRKPAMCQFVCVCVYSDYSDTFSLLTTAYSYSLMTDLIILFMGSVVQYRNFSHIMVLDSVCIKLLIGRCEKTLPS